MYAVIDYQVFIYLNLVTNLALHMVKFWLISRLKLFPFIDFRVPNRTFTSSEPNKCYRVIEEDVLSGQYNHFIYKFNVSSKEWIENSLGYSGGGIYSEPLPGHHEFYQSSRVAIGVFCGQHLRFPDAVLVVQNSM